jgi:hypothetical protein
MTGFPFAHVLLDRHKIADRGESAHDFLWESWRLSRR